MKHFTIPIFVPELACPNRCVFCNQHSISGCQKQPEPDEVREIIQKHLGTIPEKDTHIEIGFFGGSFTGIEPELQEKYLAVAKEFLVPEPRWSSLSDCDKQAGGVETTQQIGAKTAGKHRIHGIRLSTRPDYIDNEILTLLKRYGVTTIELGAQSLDDGVLQHSGRGHTVADVEKASAVILAAGFKLGLQMMTGLPGDTAEKSLRTAKRIVELGASCTRIYPTLVIRGTELEQRWRQGKYKPQSLDEAIEISARLLEIFHQAGVEVLRVGLHPSEGILNGTEMLAGPFHPSFRELVETFIWKHKLLPFLQQNPEGSTIRIPVPTSALRYAIGYDSSNRKMLEHYFSKVEFVVEEATDAGLPFIIADKRLPLPAKNTLKSIGRLHVLQTDGLVYKSISGHPDILICQGDEGLVIAPGLSIEIKKSLTNAGIELYTGSENPGKAYPESARYNAVVTSEYIIHNMKITSKAIFETFPGRKHLHVNQGYTRCNLLALNNECFITSDKGIEKVLLTEGKQVLFVDPSPIRLKGQKFGFFGGCCGIYNNEVLIAGSLHHHPQGDEIRVFIAKKGFSIKELYDGPLVDVGGIFILNTGKKIN